MHKGPYWWTQPDAVVVPVLPMLRVLLDGELEPLLVDHHGNDPCSQG